VEDSHSLISRRKMDKSPPEKYRAKQLNAKYPDTKYG
jgi:hypothetical protein